MVAMPNAIFICQSLLLLQTWLYHKQLFQLSASHHYFFFCRTFLADKKSISGLFSV
jgi:hypothetical protein